MRTLVFISFAVTFWLCIALNCSTAGEPELMPLTGPSPAVAVGSPPSFYRANRWDVWQYYAVDRTGHWRPRVVLTPEPHYLINGKPYGLLSVKPQDFMPYVSD